MSAKSTNSSRKIAKNNLPPSKLKEVKDRIPWGGINRISKKTGLSKCYVSQVLSGTRWNKRVIKVAKEVIREHEAEMEELGTI